jgi:hypothetical protein
MIDEVKRWAKKRFRGLWRYNDKIRCTMCWNNLTPRVWLCIVVLGVILGLFL